MKKIIYCLLLVSLLSCEENDSPKEKNLDEYFSGLPSKEVRETIVISKPGVYDFDKVVHVWKGKGSCNQQENQPQILRVEADNVTVKNFYFKGSSGDPVHLTTCGDGQGNKCSRKGPRNVVIDNMMGHACEDLMTIGSPGAENITIQNSTFFPNPNEDFQDKTIQVNFGKDIKFLNNKFVGGKRCIRIKPSTSVFIKDNKFINCKEPIRASANDADISPMENGQVRIQSDSCDKVTKLGDVKCSSL
jgi:hypothetical protein